MPVKAATTITDATTTPTGAPVATDRIFTPGEMEGNTHVFYNDDTGVSSAAQSYLKVSLSRATAQRPTNRIRYELALPKEHTVDGVPEVHHVNRAITEYIIHEDSDVDERHDLCALSKDVQNDTAMLDIARKIEGLY
jgi:hypothetical protein